MPDKIFKLQPVASESLNIVFNSSPRSVVHRLYCLWGSEGSDLPALALRCTILKFEILMLLSYHIISYHNSVRVEFQCKWFNLNQFAFGPQVATRAIFWTFFSFIFVAKEATCIWMPKLKTRILDLFKEVIDVLRAWLHDHTLLVSYENMGSILLGWSRTMQHNIRQNLCAKPCGAYDDCHHVTIYNYKLPNPASQWQHWSLAVNVPIYIYIYTCNISYTSAMTGWWFQPLWKILVKMGIVPK